VGRILRADQRSRLKRASRRCRSWGRCCIHWPETALLPRHQVGNQRRPTTQRWVDLVTGLGAGTWRSWITGAAADLAGEPARERRTALWGTARRLSSGGGCYAWLVRGSPPARSRATQPWRWAFREAAEISSTRAVVMLSPALRQRVSRGCDLGVIQRGRGLGAVNGCVTFAIRGLPRIAQRENGLALHSGPARVTPAGSYRRFLPNWPRACLSILAEWRGVQVGDRKAEESPVPLLDRGDDNAARCRLGARRR